MLFSISCFLGANFYLGGEEYAKALPGNYTHSFTSCILGVVTLTPKMVVRPSKRNFDFFYLQNGWGWDEAEKRHELFEEEARYLLVTQNSQLVAFVHFRFLLDEDGKRMHRDHLFITKIYFFNNRKT